MSDQTISKKAKIRERYKGISLDELDIIPADPVIDFQEDVREKRVAVYARVSTDDPRQTSSYELQKNHYTDVISRHEGWNLVEIYADEGISGTSLQHRDAFLRMIEDCKAGKIDLIVTKSVSRFARNVLDCIGYVRSLKALPHPVAVYFETEGIYTLNSNSEMSLSFIATLAQEESHNRSEIMNVSIEMRFSRGIFLTPKLLGYDVDEDGNLVINEEEAKTVRLIFFMYLFGYSSQQIADTLTQLNRRTKKNNYTWSASGVIQVLQNERHCGDVLGRKTYTPNYLDHKSKKNKHNRNQYLQKDHHEAIITRDDFIAAQKMIQNAKYKNRGFLPELHVIQEGVLGGFVSINPRWAGFKKQDYLDASRTVDTLDNAAEKLFECIDGYQGYQVARGQFFNSGSHQSVTVTNAKIIFGVDCIRRFKGCLYVELLIHPRRKMLAVRKAKKEDRNAIQWAKVCEGRISPRPTSGAAFLPTLYQIAEWKEDYPHKLNASFHERDGEAIFLIDLNESWVLMPLLEADAGQEGLMRCGNKIMAYPQEWAESFGLTYHDHLKRNRLNPQVWNAFADGAVVINEDNRKVTQPDQLRAGIRTMITEMRQGEQNNGQG